jgi:hypothetical protein
MTSSHPQKVNEAGRRLAVRSAIFLLLCVMSCQNAGVTGAGIKSVEGELRAISKNRKLPSDLFLTYDDMHGLWGGMTINIRGSGSGEVRERARGDAKPEIVETTISENRLLELIELLIELRAWEQRTPERPAVPDESKARLTIRVGERTSNVWEWFNEMSKNNRLIQIKSKMGELVKKK